MTSSTMDLIFIPMCTQKQRHLINKYQRTFSRFITLQIHSTLYTLLTKLLDSELSTYHAFPIKFRTTGLVPTF